ncbi:hypothetical protein EVAR_76904_1 [Eumeta japonica]|uniref:Uncharacterized protein n=1 Tax=Eumeta variegata TaxID=151549 RepID=A0A4C1SHG4_EUMVA|nr:hypothetical protein EVAR_76904_1 [Eumeta japonica]
MSFQRPFLATCALTRMFRSIGGAASAVYTTLRKLHVKFSGNPSIHLFRNVSRNVLRTNIFFPLRTWPKRRQKLGGANVERNLAVESRGTRLAHSGGAAGRAQSAGGERDLHNVQRRNSNARSR